MSSLKLPETGFDANGADLIDEALATVREHFGMPVAYLSRFDGDTLIFRNVSAPGLDHLIKPNDQMMLKETYCPRILSGELPNLIPDTSREPICQELPITSAVPIGSHISLPVRLEDGTPYGMFCCLSPEPNHTLNDRDLAIMSSFVGLVARQVQQELKTAEAARRDRQGIEAVLRDSAFAPAFQPLISLPERRVVGVEALVRFAPLWAADTEAVFRQASHVGLGLELELAAMVASIECHARLDRNWYLSLNASPELICDPRFDAALTGTPPGRLVIEVTEHNRAHDLSRLKSRIEALQFAGIRVAIDDVGTGYSDFQLITHLSPDMLKIDRSIVSALDSDPTKRAAVAALCYFAAETGPVVLAEGVETEAEAKVLNRLGVPLAQGYLFGRPASVEALAGHMISPS